MARASPTAVSTGKRRCRRLICWRTRSRQGGMRRRANQRSLRPDAASRSREAERGVVRRALLTAATDALDLLVESGVFLAQRVVRIGDILLVWNVTDARLTVTDRRLDR